MKNLLTETLALLSHNGKAPADVRWVGVLHPAWLAGINPQEAAEPIPTGTWDDFASFADFEYDNGYGGNVVEGDLVIVGDDWWLERGGYDGSEWWEFKALPQRPESSNPLRRADLREH